MEWPTDLKSPFYKAFNRVAISRILHPGPEPMERSGDWYCDDFEDLVDRFDSGYYDDPTEPHGAWHEDPDFLRDEDWHRED